MQIRYYSSTLQMCQLPHISKAEIWTMKTTFKPQVSCFEVNNHSCKFYGEIYYVRCTQAQIMEGTAICNMKYAIKTILHNLTKSTPAYFVFLP